ncbi:hypothetical protein KSP40_PGU010300 [Platanthera guangdongensis]|uniref:Uncharacterized protein n=1 Tax=Platanthera guangdongensis TaxID=2320717 RepID=A0ABR2MRI9_9ASPA
MSKRCARTAEASVPGVPTEPVHSHSLVDVPLEEETVLAPITALKGRVITTFENIIDEEKTLLGIEECVGDMLEPLSSGPSASKAISVKITMKMRGNHERSRITPRHLPERWRRKLSASSPAVSTPHPTHTLPPAVVTLSSFEATLPFQKSPARASSMADLMPRFHSITGSLSYFSISKRLFSIVEAGKDAIDAIKRIGTDISSK